MYIIFKSVMDLRTNLSKILTDFKQVMQSAILHNSMKYNERVAGTP